MTDQSAPGLPLPQEPALISPPPAAAPAGKKTTRTVIIVVVAVVAAVCLMCFTACALLYGRLLVIAVTEKDDVAQVCDQFMQAMEARDVDAAYALFSARARRQIPLSQFEALVQGNNYVLFEDYESLEITDLTIHTVVNTNPGVPQGMVAEVEGVIHYTSGPDGRFIAVLEKEDGRWMLDGFNVTVSPERFSP